MQALLVALSLVGQGPGTIGPYLRVDFQEGFQGWKVQLFLDDSLAYRGSPETNPVEGLAGGVDLMCRSTLVELRFRAFGIGVDSTFTIDIPDGEFVGLSVSDDGSGAPLLRVTQSSSPFGYD